MDLPKAAAQVAGVDLVEPFAHPGVRGRRLNAERRAEVRFRARTGSSRPRSCVSNRGRDGIRWSDRLGVRVLSGSGMRSKHAGIPGIDGCLRKEGLDMVLRYLCLYCRQQG